MILRILITLFLLGNGFAQVGEMVVKEPKKKQSDWPNWVFAATMVVTAITGVLIVSSASGKEAPH